MFAVIAACIYGLYLTVSFTRKKELSILEGAGWGMFLIACIFMCCVVLVLPIDEPRYEIVKGDECAIVQVEDDFVVVQLGDGRLDTIYRTLHPITNWEPVVDKSYHVDIDGNKYTFVDKNGQVTFERTLNPTTNWEPVECIGHDTKEYKYVDNNGREYVLTIDRDIFTDR